MPVVELENVPLEPFKGGATYQTIVGDQAGSTPIRVGIQTSPPGYKNSTSLASLYGDRDGARGRGRSLAW